MQAYQALLARAESLASVRARRRAIEAVGGKIEIAPPTSTGMVVVKLWLPPPYQPYDFIPDLPFYPC
jgi:hypothetical protein